MKIDPYTYEATMVRGDSESISVKCPLEPFASGDFIEFSVRKNIKKDRIIHKVVSEFDEEGKAYILLNPEDTEDLDFGVYVYDIQLTRSSGWTKHIIPASPLILKGETTHNG